MEAGKAAVVEVFLGWVGVPKCDQDLAASKLQQAAASKQKGRIQQSRAAARLASNAQRPAPSSSTAGRHAVGLGSHYAPVAVRKEALVNLPYCRIQLGQWSAAEQKGWVPECRVQGRYCLLSNSGRHLAAGSIRPVLHGPPLT